MFKFVKSESKLRNEKGASAVEFALVLPIFVMVIFGIFQFGIAFNNWIAITHAAREGARLAAVGQYDEQRVRDSAPSVQIQSITVSGQGGSIGSPVTVIVTGNVLNINIPLVNNWPVTLTSTAVMRLEQ
jgi:Flp pilus assembly protein TadG